ncbi:MAG: dockerin type I domain-containing protein, partial [Phycisphaerales bacterium]
MCIRNLRGTAKQSVMPGSAAALLASAGLLCTTGAATASTNNPQNGPAPAFQPNGPDLNGSGYVDFADLMMVLSVMSNPATVNPAWVTAADLNEDGVVDFADLSVLLSSFGQFIPPPPPEPPAPPPPPPEEPQFVSLVPGSGFWGPIADPGVVGDPNGYGGDAKAAARWNAIPGQFISGDFNVGVVAFHMSGINRVEFTAN